MKKITLIPLLLATLQCFSQGTLIPDDSTEVEWEYVGSEQFRRRTPDGITSRLDNSCGWYSHPGPACGRMYNRAFLPETGQSLIPLEADPFTGKIFGWRSSHGTPQIGQGGAIPSYLNFPTANYNYASMLGFTFLGTRQQRNSEGIIGNIRPFSGGGDEWSLIPGNTYYLTFYRRLRSNNGGSPLTSFQVVLLNCAQGSQFPGNTSFTTPWMPPGSQSIYCEQNPQNSGVFERVVVPFVPTDAYDLIWIYPSLQANGTNNGSWLDILDVSIESFEPYRLKALDYFEIDYCGPNNTLHEGFQMTSSGPTLFYRGRTTFISASCELNCRTDCDASTDWAGYLPNYYSGGQYYFGSKGCVAYSSRIPAGSGNYFKRIVFEGAVTYPNSCGMAPITYIDGPLTYNRPGTGSSPGSSLSVQNFGNEISVYNGGHKFKTSITIYNSIGQCMYKRNDQLLNEGENRITLSFPKSRSTGIYIVVIKFAESVVSYKILM